jgi:mannonate dehydratase
MGTTIRDIRVILTAPDKGVNLVVVRVETSEPGLSGLGCATFTQRPLPVKVAVESYLKPLLVGREVDRIEDIYRLCHVHSYWRNGSVLNNAISGVDMALWDIKGKQAGMPVYQLLGGACREAVAVYRHCDGKTPEEVEENVLRHMEEGYRYLRVQMGWYGMAGAGDLGGLGGKRPVNVNALPTIERGRVYDPELYARNVPRLFDHLRKKIGFDVELLHDVHERLTPTRAVLLAKELEQYRLFYLEDPLAPEDGVEWFRAIRSQCATPIAVGELFNNPSEWLPLVSGRLIDFIRMHISQMGGLTMARKVAAMAELHGIRTAWHGPWDVSPVGHACNMHLDLASPNFGVQEWPWASEAMQEVFPGCPVPKNGFLYPSDKLGFGVELDEEKAAKYPCDHTQIDEWTEARWPDGTLFRP